MMRSCLLPFVVLLLVSFGLCFGPDVQPMDSYPPGQSERNMIWQKTTSPGQDLTDEGLLHVAQAHYNWLSQLSATRGKTNLIVAAMWDPVGKKVWAATSPSWSVARLMSNPTNYDRAPLWWSFAKDTKPLQPNFPKFFHAEDRVYFNWESSDDGRLVNGKYPSGATMVVYGRFGVDGDAGETRLCGSNNGQNARKSPTCMQIASDLGVRYKTQLPPQPAVDPQWSDDIACNPDGGSSRRFRKRADSVFQNTTTSCPIPTLGPNPAPVNADNLSFSLSPADYTSATTTSSSVTSALDSTKATITPPPTTTTTTTGPTPSCSLQNEDPDQGINTRWCVCESSITLPLLSMPSTVVETESCHYTAIPTGSIIHPTPSLGPAQTDTKLCQVCTPVVINESDCTSIPNCIVQTAAATILAGSSPIHAGTMTSSQLYTSVSNALQSLCPEVTQTTSLTACSTGTVEIPGVPYVSDESLEEGSIEVSVELSAYNVTSLRDAMIKSIATSAQNSAVGQNCYNVSYMVEELKRDDTFWGLSRLFRRDRPHSEPEHDTHCNMINFATAQYWGPYARFQQSLVATDYIDAHFSFQTAPGGDFLCELLHDTVDAFAVIAPEFAVEDVELGEAIDVLCESEDS